MSAGTVTITEFLEARRLVREWVDAREVEESG